MSRRAFVLTCVLVALVGVPARVHAIGCVTAGCSDPCTQCNPTTNTCQAIQCDTPGTCFKLPGTCSGGVCQYTVNPGAACSDGNACTKNDTCQSNGSCAGTAYSCAIPGGADGTCWTSTSCDGSGGCTNVFKSDTTACDKDGNACTVGDHCDGTGHCLAGAPMQCTTPSNPQCYDAAGSCSNGTCGYTVKSGGCDDGDPCTYQDSCQADGSCKGLLGRSCAATADCPIAGLCDGNGGCTPPADRDTKGDCAGKQPGDACSTCNPCLQSQTCSAAGDCVGAPVSDGVSCISDDCPNGMCVAGACTCMSLPTPDLAFAVVVDMAVAVDPGAGGDPHPNPNPNGGGESGGCAVGGDRPASRGALLLLVVGLLVIRARRRAAS